MFGELKRRSAFLLPLAAWIVLAVSGCAQLSVSHLQRTLWDTSQPRTLTTKFFDFTFEARNEAGFYAVTGTARPLAAKLPAWADQVEDLSITVYLCDGQGRILGQAEQSYPPRPITGAGIPFEMFLRAKPSQDGTLFVSMGYRAMFVASRQPATAATGSGGISGQYVFFASENAALQN